MPFTYAIADLHGRYDLLEAAIAELMKREEPGTIVTLGDYIDRGPQSMEIITRLMHWADDSRHRLVCLKGNHEDIMLQTCRKPLDPDWWLGNGGGFTLISYGHARKGPVDLTVVSPRHLDWIEHLPLYHCDQHRIYVHAGVRRGPINEQSEDVLTWMLYRPFDEGGHIDSNGHERHVVHGHQQFADGPILKKHRTDLDTFAWYTGRLVVGVFDDDKPGGPIDLIEVKGEPGSAPRRWRRLRWQSSTGMS